MASTLEKLGLVGLALGAYATAESIINRVDSPNRATNNDVVRVRQDVSKVKEDLKVMDTRIQAVDDGAAKNIRVDALDKALAVNSLGDCVNENILARALDESEVIITPDQCLAERQQWYNMLPGNSESDSGE